MNIVIKNLLELMQERNINGNQLQSACSLSNSAIAEWKKGKAKPSQKTLERIAGYFNVSVAYFYEEEHKPKEKPTGEAMGYERTIQLMREKGINEKDLSNDDIAFLVEHFDNFVKKRSK